MFIEDALADRGRAHESIRSNRSIIGERMFPSLDGLWPTLQTLNVLQAGFCVKPEQSLTPDEYLSAPCARKAPESAPERKPRPGEHIAGIPGISECRFEGCFGQDMDRKAKRPPREGGLTV